MASNGQEIQYFMSVGVSATPIPDLSFEELRVQDYLKFYQTTGRTPVPCPQSPETPIARAALGLPPLFVPIAIAMPTEKLSSDISTKNASPISQLSDLPAHHDFQPTKTVFGEFFESISAQTLYGNFSHEVGISPLDTVGAELRHQAYLLGNKIPPISSTGHVVDEVVNAPPTQKFYANDSRATSFMTSSAAPGAPDYFMSIVASPKFDKHSFEELRIACLLAGKEVGSSEIPTRGALPALPAQPAPTLFGRPRGDAFSSSSLKLF